MSIKKKGISKSLELCTACLVYNIYLKYKSILLLLDFGFFYIEDTMSRFRGGTSEGRAEWRGALFTLKRAVWEESINTSFAQNVSYTIPLCLWFYYF